MATPVKSIFRILFHNQNKVYERYAHQLSQSTMLGFIEIGDIIFGERSQLLVDPAEEKLKSEFGGINPHVSPGFVARLSRCRGGGLRGLKGDAGVADTPSNRLQGAQPVEHIGSRNRRLVSHAG